jgi:signal transduction histidine kinase
MRLWLRRKPEALALIVALLSTVLVLTLFLSDAYLSRSHEIEVGKRRTELFSIMLAEHTARALEALDILLREMATDLGNNHDWRTWDPNRGWEYVTRHHSRALPQLRDLAIFDQRGEQRFISTYFPTPPLNLSAQPYFGELIRSRQGVSVGTISADISGQQYSYALARRIENTKHQFTGFTYATLETAYLQEFCWPNRLADDFETVVINSRNEIIASCRPLEFSANSGIIGKPATATLYAGRLLDPLPEQGFHRANGLLVSLARVPGFADLRVLTVLPEETLLGEWRKRLVELGILSTLVTSLLLAGGLVVRHQVRDLGEATSLLKDSHETLAARVAQATAELSAQKDAAELANTAKSRFLAAASHDLRQPLHALSLFVADLQRKTRSGANTDLPLLAEQITASTSVLGELLNSLLDISRLDIAGISPQLQHFELNLLFKQLHQFFQRTAVDRNIGLHFRPTEFWADSDPVVLERILANLISNALRYTQPGGNVLVAARKRGDFIRIDVRDNGPGIAVEHQSAIFTEFYQVGNQAREQKKGLGLGLSIVDRLARSLKAGIDLRSEPGGGSCFSVTVPLITAENRMIVKTTTPFEPRIHFVGHSGAIASAIELTIKWNLSFSHDPAPDEVIGALPHAGIIICACASLDKLRQIQPAGTRTIVLDCPPEETLAPGENALQSPLRPAKLRALIAQLQKAMEKSTP